MIEGVRLARTLAALHEGLAPTLRDLRDAAVTLIGHGELSTVSEAFAQVDVGTAIGELPKGVSQTSIQTDFERELNRLKLEKYRTTVKQELTLDLRENRRAKSDDAAYLDLYRSGFFHRLRMLGIGFAQSVASGQQTTTWAEKWHLQWSPESEISLGRSRAAGRNNRTGDRVQVQDPAGKLHEHRPGRGPRARRVPVRADVSSMYLAQRRLQELAAVSSDLETIAHAAFQLGQVVRYGDVRKFDPTPLLPLMEELFVSEALALFAAANCDNDAARKMLVAIEELNRVSLEHADRVEEKLWLEQLKKLADADDRNPLLSGYACATLLERGLVANEDLAREVSRRL